MAWDSKVRGRGVAAKGIPQGSWLSSIPFMVCMAPMLEEMERRVEEKVGRLTVPFPSWMDDIQCGFTISGVLGKQRTAVRECRI